MTLIRTLLDLYQPSRPSRALSQQRPGIMGRCWKRDHEWHQYYKCHTQQPEPSPWTWLSTLQPRQRIVNRLRWAPAIYDFLFSSYIILTCHASNNYFPRPVFLSNYFERARKRRFERKYYKRPFRQGHKSNLWLRRVLCPLSSSSANSQWLVRNSSSYCTSSRSGARRSRFPICFEVSLWDWRWRPIV